MRLILKLIAGAGAMALATGAAQAQQTFLNGQVQLNNVTSTYNVQVLNVQNGDFAGTSVAYGNVAAASQSGVDYTLTSNQDMRGNTTATLLMDGNQIDGTTAASVAAIANSLTADNCCGDITGDITQTNTGNVVANARVRTTAVTNGLTSGITGYANSVSLVGSNATLSAYVNQTNSGTVSAQNDVDICCTTDAVTVVTAVGANAISGTGTSTTTYLDTEQRSNGTMILGNTDIYAVQGYNVSGSSSAVANSVAFSNAAGYAQASGYQENSSLTQSEAYVTLDNWAGYAQASSYGVGNSVLLGNTVSDTRLDYVQNNLASGEIVAFTRFEGGAGGDGSVVAGSTAIGNAITGTLCSTCGEGGGVYGSSEQYNYAAVTATTLVNAGNANGGVIGSAAAIGNTATFGVVRSGH
jgi:hypothetical protein